jgi:hypothetical protein
MYFEDSDGEELSVRGASESRDEEPDAEEGGGKAAATGNHASLYSIELLPALYDALPPFLSSTQVVLLLGGSPKYPSAPDRHMEQFSRLKTDSEFYKTCTVQGDVVIINPHLPSHVTRVKRSERSKIYQTLRSCKGDPDALTAALQKMVEGGQVTRTKRQASASDAVPPIVSNTFGKTSAMVDLLITASTQNDKDCMAALVSEKVDTLDDEIDIFKMAVLKKDRFGMRAIYLNDILKILFNSSSVKKVVVVNLSGGYDESDDEAKLPPVFTEEPDDKPKEKEPSDDDKELSNIISPTEDEDQVCPKQTGGAAPLEPLLLPEDITESAPSSPKASSAPSSPKVSSAPSSPKASSAPSSPKASSAPSSPKVSSAPSSPRESAPSSPKASSSAPSSSRDSSDSSSPVADELAEEPEPVAEGGAKEPRAADRVPQKTRRKSVKVAKKAVTQRTSVYS